LDNSDYYIEVGAMDKLRYAVDAKRINDELMEHLATSLTWILHYCAKNNLPLPNQEKIDQIVDNAIKFSSTDFLHSFYQPQNGQSPKNYSVFSLEASLK
jgi:hypothetical protein